MRVQFEQSIYELMKQNDRILALVADSGTGKYKEIQKEMPKRYFDFGIAENTMISVAAGLASEGWIPVVYAINNFLAYRSYEFIRNDICLDHRNVKIVGLGAGVIQNMQGPTHHTLEDIAALRAIPNLVLLSPGSPKEVKGALEAAIAYDGPVYIRLAKAYETEMFASDPPAFKIGGFNIPQEGSDITLISTGSITGDVCIAAKTLQKENISIQVININSLKPIDEKGILREVRKTHKVIAVEEHNVYGGLGSIISEILAKSGEAYSFRMMGFADKFCLDYGWHQELKRMNGLSPEHIAEACRSMYKGE